MVVLCETLACQGFVALAAWNNVSLLGLLDKAERIVVVLLRQAQHDHALKRDLVRLELECVEILEHGTPVS